jgi:hypothetical protein
MAAERKRARPLTKDVRDCSHRFRPVGRGKAISSGDRLSLTERGSDSSDTEGEGTGMTNLAVGDKHHNTEEYQYYSWLEDYLERLDGKDAYREFQERTYDDPEYYALVASLAA